MKALEEIYNVLLEYQRTRDVTSLHAHLGLFNKESHVYHEVAGFLCGDCRDLVRMDTLVEKLRKDIYCTDPDCDGKPHEYPIPHVTLSIGPIVPSRWAEGIPDFSSVVRRQEF